ncbi:MULTISPECIES: universal stress protein [unclassified Leisingera]|uniref:universal stress protein n=1 Tax=unclassified Leisingera TaxID=2614906 RepID=UPI0002F457C3|nr:MULTISPECIES: universal stress protein [unclassified Leisingera]KIC17775.1 universal stress protein UspA [Leisingera sp. ANG-DT]KIC23950.1 universal stress protein UspA [Leisingera sp. ANG-S3]KIC53987.1 universal stress protein UspA [Leisingera sp. ANG-S]KID09618.1 universal stress protein UspA [Leisingera sp. ANG1]
MYQKILCPVDGSDGSGKALDDAAKLARLTQAQLLILTVFRHHSLLDASLSMVDVDDPDTVEDVLRTHAVSICDKAKSAALQSGANNVRAVVKRGPPARTILGFAEQNGADLIVLGGRGSGDSENYLLGSVSHKVTSLAKCSVLVT